MNHQSINFFGLAVEVTSNNNLFTSLVESKFGNFHTNSTESLLEGNVHISFGELKNRNTSWEKIDSQIEISNQDNSVKKKHFYLGQEITTELHYDVKQKMLDISLSENKSIVFSVLNALSRGMLKRQLYQNVLKLYVEQPLYHLVSKEKNLFCLHASGVTKKGQGTLFYGLNGVGKSTLAQYLLKNREYQQSSDNYTLVSKTTMYASPESVRLATDSISLLNVEVASEFGFGKKNITTQESEKTKSKIATIVFVSRGTNYSLNKIAKNDFIQLLRLQEVNGEDVQSSVLANLSYFSEKNAYPVQKANYYQVTMSSYDDLEKVANELHT